MTYSITEKLIHGENRPGTPLKASGIAIHSTATPGATDEAEQSYFENNKVGASAHYFVDWDSITKIIPESEVAWHAGPTANKSMISIEMCEPKGHNVAQFFDVWRRMIWLTADICRRHKISVSLIWSHAMISAAWRETDHTDPTAYLAAYGKTFDDLRREVELALKPKPEQEEEDMNWYNPGMAREAHEVGGLSTGKLNGKQGVVWAGLRAPKKKPITVKLSIIPEVGSVTHQDIELTSNRRMPIRLAEGLNGGFNVKVTSLTLELDKPVKFYLDVQQHYV